MMNSGDYEVFMRLHENFKNATAGLREQHNREIQDLRTLYLEAKKRITELEYQNQILKAKFQ